MIISELKPWSETLNYLKDDRKVFIVGCKGCAESCKTGGEPQVLEAKAKLEQEGKTITGYTLADFLCDKSLVKLKLWAHQDEVAAADSLLVMTCGIGVQATAAVVDKPVHPACNTISVGGTQGEWRGDERCYECGDCLLDFTGGICPLTACTKSLINGPCGGAKDGRCEFEPDARECGWHRIYLRLKNLGKLDKMKAMVAPKDYSKMQPPRALRATIMWALEQQEKVAR